jgi:hypothetical protein
LRARFGTVIRGQQPRAIRRYLDGLLRDAGTLLYVWYSTPWDGLTPDERVAYAVAPFVVAMLLRVLLGKTQFSRWTIAISTMWFAINVLMAPYSAGVRQELVDLGNHFR